MLARVLEPEWLDHLPADDPRARRSRRDLRRVNALMRQAGIMRHLLQRGAQRPPRRILELGGGDGSFMLAVARRLAPSWRDVTLVLLDRQDLVTPETRGGFRDVGWRVETVMDDVFAFLRNTSPAFDAITANLFLHHFAPPQLAELAGRAARLAPLFVACEPRRSALALAASRALWAIGCNDVSRHDAVTSVRAGFNGRELSELWPRGDPWQFDERALGLFTHGFVARRGGAVAG